MKVTAQSDKFLWLANCLALDLVNTQVRHDGPIEDLLETPGDLLDWFTGAGLIRKNSSARLADDLGERNMETALTLLRKYRAQIRKSLQPTGFRVARLATVIRTTNDLLAVPTRIKRLKSDVRGQRKLVSEWQFSSGQDLLRPIAASLAQLLANREAGRLRRCKNPACILYFYDVSKSNTRVWCSLDICGNKARVAAFRARHSKN